MPILTQLLSILRERGHFAVAGSYDNWLNVFDDHLKIENHCHEHFDTIELSVWDEIIYMQDGGEHFIGRDELEVTDDEWEVRCIALAKRLDL